MLKNLMDFDRSRALIGTLSLLWFQHGIRLINILNFSRSLLSFAFYLSLYFARVSCNFEFFLIEVRFPFRQPSKSNFTTEPEC